MKKLILAILIGFTLQQSYAQLELKEDFDKGVKLLQSGNYKNAIDIFSSVLTKATDDKLKKFCYIYRAFSYNGLYDYKKAIDDLDNAIKLDSSDLASFVDRGKEKVYAKDFDGAKDDFLLILTKDSTDEQGQAAFYYLAKIEYQAGKPEKSIEYYDKLIQLTPDDPELYFDRGTAKGMLMNTEEAIKDYDKAIKLDPNYMEAYANRGVEKINLLTKKGNVQPTNNQTGDACADLKKAKQLGDKTVDDMIFIYCDKR